ncbi:MAG: uroporphyrinogen-III synthase [Bacteroidetes bacterium]|nr:MAG: uroporphyrinogen-III synthase [Bacteroidota bacterium]
MTVFISRTLPPDSIFRKLLTINGIRIHDQKLIKFEPVAVEKLPEANWLFFYSKTGVQFFFRQIPAHKVDNYRMAALGPGTAAELSKYAHVQFAGDGDPIQTAVNFLALARGQKVAFVRAEDSRQSIRKLLDGKITPIDVIVYKNTPLNEVEIPTCEVLVFTSPLNARAYFSKNEKYGFQKVIAIGNTTAGALNELGIGGVIVAESPTEEALAKKVLELKNGVG